MQQQTSSHESSGDQTNPDTKKRRRGAARAGQDTPRYQCYCDKVYLSYPALYLHLKNKHPECFLNNRKIEVTKFKELVTEDGYRMLRMEKDPNDMKGDPYIADQMYKIKNLPPYHFPGYPFPYPTHPSQQNFMMPHMDPKNFYMEGHMGMVPSSKSMPPSMPSTMSSFNPTSQSISKNFQESKPEMEVQSTPIIPKKDDIISLINRYIEEKIGKDQLERKQVMEMELLYSLLPKCIKEFSDKLRDWYNISPNEGELIYRTDLKFLEGLLWHFRVNYCKSFGEKSKQIEEGQSKQEKLTASMVRVNRYFNDLEMMNKELKRFEHWLIKRGLIEKVKENFPL